MTNDEYIHIMILQRWINSTKPFKDEFVLFNIYMPVSIIEYFHQKVNNYVEYFQLCAGHVGERLTDAGNLLFQDVSSYGIWNKIGDWDNPVSLFYETLGLWVRICDFLRGIASFQEAIRDPHFHYACERRFLFDLRQYQDHLWREEDFHQAGGKRPRVFKFQYLQMEWLRSGSSETAEGGRLSEGANQGTPEVGGCSLWKKRTGSERNEEDHGKSKEVENKGIPRWSAWLDHLSVWKKLVSNVAVNCACNSKFSGGFGALDLAFCSNIFHAPHVTNGSHNQESDDRCWKGKEGGMWETSTNSLS